MNIMSIEKRKNLSFLFIICLSTFVNVDQVQPNSHNLSQKEILEQPTRNSIYELIKLNPGLHFRSICRVLDKKMGVVQYHLKVLEKAHLIRSIRDGRYKFFFENTVENLKPGENNSQQQKFADLVKAQLRKKTTSKIIMHLWQNPNAGHQSLSDIAGVSPQAITYHTKNLVKLEIIQVHKEGCKKFYQLTPLTNEILQKIFNS